MRTLLLFLFASLTTACSTLEGEWAGDMICQDDPKISWDANFTIEKNEYGDTEFEGEVTGALSCLQDNDSDTDDIACDFIMVGTVEPLGGSGQQDLDMRIDYCSADAGILGSTGYGCENPEVAEWNGRKSIKIIHQTSGDIDCKITLDRQ